MVFTNYFAMGMYCFDSVANNYYRLCAVDTRVVYQHQVIIYARYYEYVMNHWKDLNRIEPCCSSAISFHVVIILIEIATGDLKTFFTFNLILLNEKYKSPRNDFKAFFYFKITEWHVLDDHFVTNQLLTILISMKNSMLLLFRVTQT